VDESDLPPGERSFLLKTSVDYTLCDASDQPILSIEFDGIGEGFSREGKYVAQTISSRDPNRQWKFDLKLRVCQQVFYPLVIISYEESTPIGPGLNVAIVDGIIGCYLAHKATQQRANDLFELNKEEIDALPAYEQDEYIQDLVIQAEVEMDLTWNPISRKLAELSEGGYRKGIRGESFRWLDDPALPAAGEFWRTGDPEALRRRIAELKKANRIGCEATVETPEGPVTEVAWMRNIAGVIWPGTIIEEIARLLAWRRALERVGG
jgi:hypothetical protein